MSIVNFKNCAALTWDRSGHVYGVKARQDKAVLAAAWSEDDDKSFSERLAAVYAELGVTENELVLVGGDIPGSVCVEFPVPRMAMADIPSAIRFELPRHIPVDAETLVWGYRLLETESQEENDNKKPYRARIFAVGTKEWNEMIAELAAAGVRADAFVHPWMAIDPVLAETDVCLPSIDPYFAIAIGRDDHIRFPKLRFREGDQATVEPISPKALSLNPEDFPESVGKQRDNLLPALLIAGYGLGGWFHKDIAALPNLPKAILPQRFSVVRDLCVILAVFTLIFALGYMARLWWDAKAHVTLLRAETQKLSRLINEKNNQIAFKKRLDPLFEAIDAAEVGNSDILPCVEELTRLIPKDMWLSNLSSINKFIDLSVTQAPNSSSDLEKLKNSRLFNADIRNKRKNSDGSYSITVRVEYKN